MLMGASQILDQQGHNVFVRHKGRQLIQKGKVINRCIERLYIRPTHIAGGGRVLMHPCGDIAHSPLEATVARNMRAAVMGWQNICKRKGQRLQHKCILRAPRIGGPGRMPCPLQWRKEIRSSCDLFLERLAQLRPVSPKIPDIRVWRRLRTGTDEPQVWGPQLRSYTT
jgi:hypothetical protein